MTALRHPWFRVIRSRRALASKASGEARVSAAIPSGHSPITAPITVNLYVSVGDEPDLTAFAKQMAHEIDHMLAVGSTSARGLVS